ncbi:VacJ family lipoprotein [Oleidesulfovibrio alaskensis G20]|jgi:phospholipid-binding lipoprotein MlaA|uniref:VacJ family lipoprotein n=1 Tax=Oleidesulfovibrio alaskensis (strain ATCC BAA-1058 / DSM 17464 / G20) TaxID=207559 RepID=Q30YZ8_OLEA2|nr:VacJ family lipoprotein [Oleidesulfovibrio alaskensis]ABB39098.1 VacJ family lipoprotein [Oleidesulfovibrio alaskensis G20]MBG0772132.1 VacJ family lipoprotein [Oleidesulfovibrio alaskensis]MBL3581312.1 VacJ family lipoprotein [Oleidesulfovibrio alaskensis]
MKRGVFTGLAAIMLLAAVCTAQAAPVSQGELVTPERLEKAQMAPDARDAALAQQEEEFLLVLNRDNIDPEFEDYGTETSSVHVADPIEGWNRFWFGFNDWFYNNLADPVWRGYAYVTPSELRTGADNFFRNLAYPVRFINCILQGKFVAAGVETSRFIVDSTIGVGGLMQPSRAKKPLVEPDREDFGQTLGYWGVGEGFYIVWPFLGPSTLRDSGGLVADAVTHPLYYVTPMWHGFALAGYDQLNKFGGVYDNYMAIKAPALEPYTAIRDAYIQTRRSRIAR